MLSKRQQNDFIVLDDNFKGYSTRYFNLPRHYEKYLESILISNGMILDRLHKMAYDIIIDYELINVEEIYIICLLKGGFQFAADLFNKLQSYSCTRSKYIRISIDFISASTYINDSIGHNTKINPCTDMERFRNKNVLIAEDLVDTGTSLTNVEEYIRRYNPTSVRTACLLVKRRPDCPGYQPDYVGFEVPNRFIVGYAIDYNNYFRDLPHICSVNDEGKREFYDRS
ncbi:Hypoxanthine-guanine phosphoribosyltransferase [Schistosoma japonicum]|uniref:SJCHGC05755 protein n=1 Tax=Schistosoma japonicum TaxID=6182 RepID=Q5DC76_SCHJA|nr:SJCHGC05755 protein [Schistosoma japonicum]KAH8870419.1 Hypoxanthine-guanine phosphoribosyltransferase [Schistosoma japonicum]